VTGNFPGLAYAGIFPLLGIQVLFSIGLGMTIGVLNVFFRDVGQLYGVILQFWFWLTPIIYPASILPETMQKLMFYNPMAGLIAGYQGIIVRGQWPDWGSLLPVIVLSVMLCAFGWRLFRRRVGEMVDEL
jgi:lipopolysaccharide transport system permease protein